jgi:hypothetical protein
VVLANEKKSREQIRKRAQQHHTQPSHLPNRHGTAEFHDRQGRNDGQDTEIRDTKGLEELGNLLARVQGFHSHGLFGSPGGARRGSLEESHGTES